jgi:transcriptional regulator GlxA family with amidase domain
MTSLRKSGLTVGGSDVGVEALVNPVALAEEVHLAPSARNRTELGVAWYHAHERLRLGAARQLLLSST